MTGEHDFPDNKRKRLAKASKTAAKIAGKHAAHVVKQTFSSPKKREASKAAHHKDVASEIFKTLSTLKGTALKAAQLLSMEFDFLPTEYKEELRKSCYQVPPLNKALVRKVIQNQFSQPPEQLFNRFNSEAFAAASIGQVHRAFSREEQDVVVKIQYPGVDQTIHHDIKLLKLLLLKLPIPMIKEKSLMITTFLEELEQRFSEETNYENEKQQLEWFAKNNPLSAVTIPAPVDCLCSKTVLTMDFISGKHVDQWLKTNPSKEERNHIAQSLWDFFVHFFMTYGRFHADPNPGNYLITDSGNLAVLDFGCVKQCDQEFPEQIATMIEHYSNNRVDDVIAQLRQWGLLSEEMKIDKETIIKRISVFQEWITRPFRSGRFDFEQHPEYMAERFSEDFKKTAQIMHNTTHNFVMFDRTFMGLMLLFTNLGAEVEFYFKKE